MSAELEIIDGKTQMFYIGDAPWHGLGTKLEVAPTVQDGILAAGLDWEVGLKMLKTVDEEPVDHLATYRKSDGKILGVVGPRYRPLQNKDAFDFFNPFLQEKLAALETAGSLFNGKKIWVLAKITGDPLEIVKNDVVERYILLSNSHDGTTAVRAGFSCVRVVCSNTLAMAHNSAESKLVRVRHTRNTVSNLEALRETMNVINSEFEATANQYRFLASKEISEADLKKFVKLVFAPVNKFKDISEDEEKDIVEVNSRVTPKIISLFETGRGNDMVGVRGTYWAAVNSVTEYTTHIRGRNEENRLGQLWFGASANLNKRALDVATTMAIAA